MPIKALSQRFSLPILIVASALLIVLGKADTFMFDRLRGAASDLVAPALEFTARPLAVFDSTVARFHDLAALYDENARLREENARLLQWQQVAQSLATENGRLRSILKLTPEPAVSFVTARVIANSGGAFVRSVLVHAGKVDGLVRGQAAITGEGLVGRVTEVGERTARVLLLTDLNSRIPVAVDSSRERAVLAGDNSDMPRLLYLPAQSTVKVGDRIVTSGHGGIFPPGLPVGVVASLDDGMVRVAPYVELSRVDYLRIVDYGLTGVLPQPVVPQPKGGKKGKEAVAAAPAGEEDALR